MKYYFIYCTCMPNVIFAFVFSAAVNLAYKKIETSQSKCS